jgi:hypothetical protein
MMGEYDFIAEQYELHGEDYINSLIEAGYVPHYIADRGWRWLLVQKVAERV